MTFPFCFWDYSLKIHSVEQGDSTDADLERREYKDWRMGKAQRIDAEKREQCRVQKLTSIPKDPRYNEYSAPLVPFLYRVSFGELELLGPGRRGYRRGTVVRRFSFWGDASAFRFVGSGSRWTQRTQAGRSTVYSESVIAHVISSRVTYYAARIVSRISWSQSLFAWTRSWFVIGKWKKLEQAVWAMPSVSGVAGQIGQTEGLDT